MPFGLVNASASFTGLMRKVLQMHSIDNFINDVTIFYENISGSFIGSRRISTEIENSDPYIKAKQVFHWIQQNFWDT